LLAGKDPSSAAQAIYALNNLGTPEAKQLINHALDAKDPQVRMAAVNSLAQNPDDKSMDTLIRMAKDGDASVAQSALMALGQVGSERAQAALLDASRSGKPEERAAAISGLAQLDDPAATRQLTSLMRDADPSVAQTAINSSYNGGPEVDSTLSQIVNDPSANETAKAAAAMQLRNRGSELDPATEAAVTKLAGTAAQYGGYGYGGMRMMEDVD